MRHDIPSSSWYDPGRSSPWAAMGTSVVCGLAVERQVEQDPVRHQGQEPLAVCGLSEEAVGILDWLDVFAYIYDTRGTILWANRAGWELVGGSMSEIQGRHFTEFLAEADAEVADMHFTRTTEGFERAAEYVADFIDREGGRVRVKTLCLPLMREGQAVGLLRLSVPTGVVVDDDVGTRRWPVFTPRQYEVLQLMCSGSSTREIARHLGVSYETARNHISGVLRAMDARSRIEAVVVARRYGLLGPTAGN